MLCTELARFINPDQNLNIYQIPAMAGMADRVNNPEVMKEYLEIAHKKGYTKEMLSEIASVIDFVSSRLRFMEAREYVEVLFGEPMKKQKALVDLLGPYIKGLEKKGLEIAKSASTTQEIKGIILQMIEVEKSFPRGFYPKTGRVVSLLHDNIQETKKLTKVVTIGILPDAITIRATDGANFSVQEMIKYMHTHIPEAFVEGGGHKNAGSIRFIPTKQEKVVELFKKFVGK
jgi:RecJ-like exonuclease